MPTNTTHQAKPARRRAAVNRVFLLACLTVTSLSVLILAVLLSAVFFQGTRSLFGFQFLIVPTTENVTSITLNEQRRRVEFRYADGAPEAPDDGIAFVLAPIAANLDNATIQRDGPKAFLDLPSSDQRILVGNDGNAFQRISTVGGFDPGQITRFITGSASNQPSETGFFYPLVGSIWLLVVCAAVAIPLGVGTAIFLEEYRPKSRPIRILHAIVQTNIRNLAGVPSIVYGLIGLTVFARVFGLFGSPGQFTEFEAITTNDGQQIIGNVVEDRAQRTYEITTDFFGSIQFATDDLPLQTPLNLGESTPVTGSIDLDENFRFVITTDQLGTLTLDAALATDLDQDALFEDPFQPRDITDGRLTFVGAGELIVQTPDRGIVTIDKANIDDPRLQRDGYLVRNHRYTLRHGANVTIEAPGNTESLTLDTRRTINGDAVRLDGGNISLIDRTPEGPTTWTFTTDAVESYRPTRRVQIGDEDSLFFVTLPLGTSVLAGGLTLMLVILPVVIIASQESLRSVPNSLREGSLALGSTRLQMVFRMTLPAAVPGILTGSILSMSRAIGEAAPILIIGGAGFVTFAPHNLTSEFAAMPLQIYSWTAMANREFRLVAASGIIVLLAVLFVFNATAVIIRQKLQKPLS